MESLSDLRKEAIDYFDQAKSRGVPLIAFECPCCNEELSTIQPPNDVVWDTLSICWHCGSGFFKISTHKEVRTQIPPHLSNAKQ
jgi:uncharacterized protein with PIN domain